MKKIFLATFCTIALCTSLTGQMTAPNYLYNITNIPTELPHEIYNQMDAVYTKSANVDFVGTDKSRIGIVYETLDGRSYLYMTNYISDPNNQYLYANNDPFSTEAEVDDNITYEVRHPDIRIIPGVNPNETITLLVYQRRLRNTNNDFEIMFRTIEANEDFSYVQVNPETPISVGKGPSIDAFVNIDKSNPTLSTSTFGDFAIAFSELNGYNIHYYNLPTGSSVPTMIDQAFIPITILDPAYNSNDEVFSIDIATVTNYDYGSYVEYNTIYAIYTNNLGTYSILDWKVIPTAPFSTTPNNMLITQSPFLGFSFNGSGASLSKKCKIEAMSIQQINEPLKFIAFGEHDQSGYNQYLGYEANFLVPFNYVTEVAYYGNNNFYYLDATSAISPIDYFGYMHSLDITAGIGSLGDNAFFNNRQFSIHREYSTRNLDEITLFRTAIDKSGNTIYNGVPVGSVASYNFIEVVSNNPYYSPINMFGNNGNTYSPSSFLHYAFQHVSNAASLNTGEFILTAWIERGNVYYKSFNDHYDIDVLPMYMPRWNQKVLPATDQVINIVPNPATNQFLVSAQVSEMNHIAVVDMLGRTVYAQSLNHYETMVSTNNWSAGNYQVIIHLKDGTKYYQKVVVLD